MPHVCVDSLLGKRLGSLYVTGGTSYIDLLEDRPFLLGGVSCVAERLDRSSLTLFTCTASDNADQMLEAKQDDMAKEVVEREAHSAAISQEIARLQATIERGSDDAAGEQGTDLVRLLGARGQHQRRVKELKGLAEIRFKFEEVQERKSLTLRVGVPHDVRQLIGDAMLPVVYFSTSQSSVKTETVRKEKVGVGASERGRLRAAAVEKAAASDEAKETVESCEAAEDVTERMRH